MSSSGSVLGFVGSGEQFRNISVLQYNSEESVWKATGTIGSVAPTFLCVIPKRRLLLATSDQDQQGSVSSYLIKSLRYGSDMAEFTADTDSSHPFHMCLDSSRSQVYVIHRHLVNGFNIREDGSVGDVFKVDKFHHILVSDPEVPVTIFIPPNFDLFTRSIQKVFVTDPGKDLGTAHLYIKFLVKVCTAPDKVWSTDLRYLDTKNSCYLTYVVDSHNSTVSVFYRKQNEGAQLQRLNTYPKLWSGMSFISDSLAPLGRSYLYVANCGHNSITTFKVLTDGTLKLFGVTIMPEGHIPKHLHYARDHLYVATDDAIFVFKVEMEDSKSLGNIFHINTIGGIPHPTSMVFV